MCVHQTRRVSYPEGRSERRASCDASSGPDDLTFAQVSLPSAVPPGHPVRAVGDHLGVLPNGWQRCGSTAIEAFRFAPDRGVLQLLFREGRMVYDYPCSDSLYERFVRAPSKGRFVNEVLKPYAQHRGWSRPPARWSSW
jgi:hypothetical protein